MGRAKRKKRKIWPWVVGIPVVLILAVVVYGVIVYKDFASTLKSTYEPIERQISGKRDVPVKFSDKDPFSVLLLGIDNEESDVGRSDTMIMMTVNPEKKSTKMVSIPRDSYTEIIGRGYKDKINHAYAFGGVEMAMETTENLLDIPVDYVVQVNMKSFKDIVDAVGGVDVNNTLAFKSGKHSFSEGNIHLNGEEALAYVRMRKQDPNGDFGRQDRQKQVIQAIMREGASVSSIFNYKDIFNTISDNIRTNITFDEMVEMQKNYRSAVDTVDQMYFKQGQGQMMDGIWYYILNDGELNEIKSALKEHLAL